jgi:hypothetical protein
LGVATPRGNIALRLIAAAFGIILIITAKALAHDDREDCQ